MGVNINSILRKYAKEQVAAKQEALDIAAAKAAQHILDQYNSLEFEDYQEDMFVFDEETAKEIRSEIVKGDGLYLTYDSGCLKPECYCKTATWRRLYWWSLDDRGNIIQGSSYKGFPVA